MENSFHEYEQQDPYFSDEQSQATQEQTQCPQSVINLSYWEGDKQDEKEEQLGEEKIINQQQLYLVEKEDFKYARHYSLGALTSKNKMKQTCAGSGVLISKNLVLTAAHNIYDHRYGQNTKDLKFYLAPNGQTGKYYQIQSFRYLPQFKSEREIKNDFALLKLKVDIPLKSYLPLKVTCRKCITGKNQKIGVYGYPKCKSNYYCQDKEGIKIKLHQYGLQRKDRVTEASFEECKICYTMTTFQGHSGSPVVNNDKIIAIHVGALLSESFNKGRLITAEILDTLKQWGLQLKGDPFQIDYQKCSVCSPKQQVKYTLNSFKPTQNNNEKLKAFLNQSTNSHSSKYVNNNFYFNNKLNQNQSTTPSTSINSIKSIQNPQSLFKEAKKLYSQSKFTAAKGKFIQCLSVQERNQGKQCINSAQTYFWIGNAFYYQKNLDKAIQFYQKAISICQNKCSGKDKSYGSSLRNMGSVYLEKNMFSSAIQTYQRAMQAYESLGDKQQINMISQFMIECLKKQRELKKVGQSKKINSNMSLSIKKK